jgi:tetratricopeptide (TPR) repeat protein
LAADEEAVAFYRVLAEDNPAVHQANLARALDNLSASLDMVGRYPDALSARTESTDISRELASKDPDLYQELYQQRLGALRREYDQRGMHTEAILHHLVDPARQAPSPSSPPSS